MILSIITINYNNSCLFNKFLTSFQELNLNISFEIIIIDNNSNREDYCQLTEIVSKFEKLKIKTLRSVINLGFGAGNMYGVQNASGNYLAFINNDIIFTEDCFSPLINFLRETPNSGVCTPQQLNSSKKAVSGFDYFHGIKKELFGRRFVELFKSKNNSKRNDFPYKSNLTVDFIQGCFMLFDRVKFNKVGGFDTNIFLYFEEMDICYRLRQIGYTSNVVPSTNFIHLHGASTTKNIKIRKELLLSKIYVFRKNYSFLKFKLLQSIMSIKWFFKSCYSPVYFPLFFIVLSGGHLKHSLKQQQRINNQNLTN